MVSMKSIRDVVEPYVGIYVHDFLYSLVRVSVRDSIYGSVRNSVWSSVTVNQLEIRDGVNEAY